jgi:hypothetical protein
VRCVASLFPEPPAVDAKQLARLVRNLSSADFDTREKAAAALTKLGERAERALRKALADKPGLEMHRRIERLLAVLERPPRPCEWPILRAVWVLEKIGTAEARKRLQEVARGNGGVVVPRAAKEALARLEKGKS